MGLRNCVDAWGVPVKREGFTRPALTEPVKPPPVNKPVNKRPVNKAAVNKPNPDAGSRASAGHESAAPEQAPTSGADRAAYMREYMRAKRAAKVKDKAERMQAAAKDKA